MTAASSVVVWRIAADTPDYVADDQTGAGAQRTGGRWNRAGTPMLYCSSSRALAYLETVVHLANGAPLPLHRYLVSLTLPDDVWSRRTQFRVGDMGTIGWDATPPGTVSLNWGTSWARRQSSCVAQVPSVIVPEESNILLNPQHPDMARVQIEKVRRWTYDSRVGALR